MRISDWSSDVCSSDLGVASRAKDGDRAGEPRVRDDADRGGAALRHLDGPSLHLAQAVAVGGDRGVRAVRDRRRGACGPHGGGAATVGSAASGDFAARGTIWRVVEVPLTYRR